MISIVRIVPKVTQKRKHSNKNEWKLIEKKWVDQFVNEKKKKKNGCYNIHSLLCWHKDATCHILSANSIYAYSKIKIFFFFYLEVFAHWEVQYRKVANQNSTKCWLRNVKCMYTLQLCVCVSVCMMRKMFRFDPRIECGNFYESHFTEREHKQYFIQF